MWVKGSVPNGLKWKGQQVKQLLTGVLGEFTPVCVCNIVSYTVRGMVLSVWLVWTLMLNKVRKWINYDRSHSRNPAHSSRILWFISSFGWTLPFRWTSSDCRSAAIISEPCHSPEWERPQRASSSWITCPRLSSTISLSSPSTAGLLSLWKTWTHTSRYDECVSLCGDHCHSLKVCLLVPTWSSAAISWPRPSSPSACQFWRVNSTQTTAVLIWVWLRRSAVSNWREPCSPTWAGTCWRCLILWRM